MLAKNTQTIVATSPVLLVKEKKKFSTLCPTLPALPEKNPEYGQKRGINVLLSSIWEFLNFAFHIMSGYMAFGF